MEEQPVFVMSTSESECGDDDDGGKATGVCALAVVAPEGSFSRHSAAAARSIDEVLFGDGSHRRAVSPGLRVQETDSDTDSSCGSSSNRSAFMEEGVGEEAGRLSRSPGVAGDRVAVEPYEHPMSAAALRGMTCADVRAVLEPFFQRKEAARMHFDAAQQRVEEAIGAKMSRGDKNLLERWRRLVNISNWGDGSVSSNDVLLPEVLVPPAATKLGIAGASTITTVASELRQLRPHQIDGIRFLWSILVEGPVGRVPAVGCILAHTMGLGKTCQVVVFLHLFLNEQRRCEARSQRVLIVVPKSTRAAWLKEFAVWSPYFPLAQRLTPIAIDERDSARRRSEVYEGWCSEGGVLLVGYEMLLGLTKLSTKEVKGNKKGCRLTDLLICDEAHRLKSTHLQISAALRGLHPLRRLLLTGTPLQNHLQEYWAMVDFALHKYFERRRFQEFFINPIEASVAQEASPREVAMARMKTFALIRELRHFVQRVDSTPLQKELPPLHEYVLVVPLSALQARLYNRFLQLVRLERYKFNFLQAVTYANKISAHPKLLEVNPCSPVRGILRGLEGNSDEEEEEGEEEEGGSAEERNRGSCGWRRTAVAGAPVSQRYADLFQLPPNYTAAPEDGAKLYIAVRIIKAAMLRGEKTLFFSLSTKLLDLFEEIIAEMNRRWQQDGSLSRPISVCHLDGSSSGAQRESTLRSYHSERGADVLLLSMKAGGVGITITAATRVILADSGFNPADDRQAIGRAYRYGQTRPVFVYRLVCYQTLEHRLFQQKLAKEWLFRTIVEEASLKRDALAGLRLQSMFQLLSRAREVANGVPTLTDGQRKSTARLVAEDAVLADVAEHIIYAEAHEVYLQHDELVQYGAEEREFYEEYQKKGVFNVDGDVGEVGLVREQEQRKRQREEQWDNVEGRTKTLTTLVDDIIRGRAEADPQLRHLLRMMGVTVDASGAVSVVSVREAQQSLTGDGESIGVGGDDGHRRLTDTKAARTETGPRLLPVLLKDLDDEEDESVLFYGKESEDIGVVIDPSKYEPYRPGGNAQHAIFVDEDEV
ncbi:putative helicase-like protein [Trypanosoma rangeli]|uniref:Putative helicase-like protein n=1 Tax=Trypanosoma rangeli TaxID=5698 RepID=A0A3R7M9D5_TRYRA|nr:putative helicase-like protein [Trypanosoma rangeli]RNF01802.1 putative helicase-like protein [Trypanosoma rangeli]|eukprot:RNF01802.1 putative helicase-like protein [Trypanosoma rangeli]